MCTCVKCLSFVPFFFVLPYFCIFLVRQNCCIYLKFTFHFYESFPFFLPLRYDYCVQDIYIVLKTTRKLLALYTCVLSGTSLTILPPRTKMGFYFIDRARFLCGLRSSDLMVRSFGFVSLTKALKSGLETKKKRKFVIVQRFLSVSQRVHFKFRSVSFNFSPGIPRTETNYLYCPMAPSGYAVEPSSLI